MTRGSFIFRYCVVIKSFQLFLFKNPSSYDHRIDSNMDEDESIMLTAFDGTILQQK